MKTEQQKHRDSQMFMTRITGGGSLTKRKVPSGAQTGLLPIKPEE
jgi:hypothetical protein